MQLRKSATAILALALSAGLAQAEDTAPTAGSTLDKIAKNGVIVVGHRESSVPFSYYDNQQKVVGYSQDYSNAIVEAVKKKLNKLNEDQKMNMRIISAKDHGDSFRTLESGRAVAFMMDDALLAGERAKAKKPDNWEIVGKPQSQEAYGCMLRKDDPQFKKLMDDTIAQVQTSGEAEKWFDKWFKNPIPPKNLNMNFELSDEMKALFKEPNDKALN
ncbi:transporter substrate-binding domain-containing protein [Escherichia marmotae]|nr:transporter substrate-binding domain-containing protein [Escherichia marmotae]